MAFIFDGVAEIKQRLKKIDELLDERTARSAGKSHHGDQRARRTSATSHAQDIRPLSDLNFENAPGSSIIVGEDDGRGVGALLRTPSNSVSSFLHTNAAENFIDTRNIAIPTISVPSSAVVSNASSNDRVFLDFEIDGAFSGRVIIELFSSQLPITTENFRALCSGEKVCHGVVL